MNQKYYDNLIKFFSSAEIELEINEYNTMLMFLFNPI